MKDVEALAATKLFEGLPATALETLATVSERMSLAGEQLLHGVEQTDDYDFYVLLEGRISIFHSGSSHADTVLGEIGPQGLFGEFAAISGRPGWANAKTMVPSEVIKIPRADFLALLDEHPKVTIRLLQNLIGLFHNLDERIITLSEVGRPVDATLRQLFLSTL